MLTGVLKPDEALAGFGYPVVWLIVSAFFISRGFLVTGLGLRIAYLFSGMTHYGTGPAPVFFGTGYVRMGDWWRLGGLLSVVNILTYFVAGGLWWKVLGIC